VNRYRSWILTDTVHDIWQDQFQVSNLDLHLPAARGWSVRKRTLRGGRRDGVDLIEVDNGDLSFTILPTRGMGLWRGQYRGLTLGWQAPLQGPVHPKYVELADRGGIGWLAGFDEWLVRCGLGFNGPPGEDTHVDKHGHTHRQPVTLHGRIANLPAHYVEVRVGLDEPHELSVIGHVEEASLFGGRLNLISTVTTVPGSNRLVIHDVIENRGGQPAEMQLLYHCNLGPPLLGAGSRVILPVREMSPLTPRAAEGMDTYDSYAGPVAGFAEQVYGYDPLADDAGRTLAMLYNQSADRAVVLRYQRSELPCFTVWKNTAALADGYVTGLEPATNFPNFKSFERQQGRVPVLPPAGHHSCAWSIEVHDTAAGVANVLAEVVRLQSRAKATIHKTPQPRFAASAGQK
jgi:hypothetical protein